MTEKYLLILFYSASGAVKNLAHAIADGAEELDIKLKSGQFQRYQLTQNQLSLLFQKKVRFFVLKKIFLNVLV